MNHASYNTNNCEYFVVEILFLDSLAYGKIKHMKMHIINHNAEII